MTFEQQQQSPLELVRETTAWVVANAAHVAIDDAALGAFAETLSVPTAPAEWDANPSHLSATRDNADADTLAQYVLVLDALNFCFWPAPGLEYADLAGNLRATLLRDKRALDGPRLAAATAADVAAWASPRLPDLAERARLLREVGAGLLSGGFGGRASALFAAAGGDAARLTALATAHFPGFRDAAVYGGRQVFFLKRAQILAGDVHGAFRGASVLLRDVSRLTMFPDYRVPQLLHARGVLVYDRDLDAAVRSGREIAAGSAEECEIRAASVQAVERIAARIGGDVRPVHVDWALWNAAEASLASLPPHHRTRTIFY